MTNDHMNYKRWMNRGLRLALAAQREPQLLFCAADYGRFRQSVLADVRETVSPVFDTTPHDKKLYALGMWIRSKGPLPYREKFTSAAADWMKTWNMWFHDYLIPVYESVADAMEGDGGAISLEAPRPPDVHAEARADAELFPKLVILAYSEPWTFAGREVDNFMVARAEQLTRGEAVQVPRLVPAWNRAEWDAKFDERGGSDWAEYCWTGFREVWPQMLRTIASKLRTAS